MRFMRKKSGVKNIEERVGALRSDLHALQDDVKGLANGVGEAAGEAVDAAGKAYGTVEAWTSNNVGSLRQAVRRQPLASCVLSMSAGAIVGALFVRR